MEKQARLSGSIVLYKNGVEIRNVIESFLQIPLPGIRLFLVDNSPTNALQLTLSSLIAEERIEYIFNNKNIGYGAGHNIAMKKSLQQGSAFHIVLNPDIEFVPASIVDLISYMQNNTNIGLLMPKVLYESGEVQYVCKLLPTPVDFFVKRFLPRLYSRRQRDKFEMRLSGYNKIMDVPFLSGCFMVLRKEALEQCGMFDERYFMYAEDIDLTRRIHEKFRTVFYPGVSIVHGYEAASRKSIKMFFVLFANIGRYFNKWGWIWDKDRKKINERALQSAEKTN